MSLEYFTDYTEKLFEEEFDQSTDNWVCYLLTTKHHKKFNELKNSDLENKEEILADLKKSINLHIEKISPHNNTLFYEFLIECGLDVEKHKQYVKPCKIIPILSLVMGGEEKHFPIALGVFDNEKDANDALLKHAILHCGYFDEDYETEDSSLAGLKKIREEKGKDIELLLIKFKETYEEEYIEYILNGSYVSGSIYNWYCSKTFFQI